MTNQEYIKLSLEFNLFYLRILAEHAVLFVTALPEMNQDLKDEGKQIYQSFVEHLKKGLQLSYEIVEIKDCAVTKYTLDAEKKTIMLTGFPINTEITEAELNFTSYTRLNPISNLEQEVDMFNQRSIELTKNIIRYKSKLINLLSKCKLYMHVYLLMIDHNRREAITFNDILNKLLNKNNPIDTIKEAMDEELFWNDIMGEHAMFIRGMLDPSEKLLFNIANETAMKYEKLNQSLKSVNMFNDFTSKSISLTKSIQKFKTDSVEGILGCQILSVIPPILADHVLREANHYLNNLEQFKNLNR